MDSSQTPGRGDEDSFRALTGTPIAVPAIWLPRVWTNLWHLTFMMGIHAGGNVCGVWGWSVFVEVLYQHAGVLGISAHPSLPLLPQQTFKRHLKPQANSCAQHRPTGTAGSRKMKRISLGSQRDSKSQKLLKVLKDASFWP